uniref:Uncharacterized protein n=1 Tax=Oryza meridionalis TaxID=40149 RepID=A0A0E0CPI2_9ORYZ
MALSSSPCTKAATYTLANHARSQDTESPKAHANPNLFPNSKPMILHLPLFACHMWFGFAKLLDCFSSEILENDLFFGGKIEVVQSSGPKLTCMIVVIEIQQRNICKIILASIMPCLGVKDESFHA